MPANRRTKRNQPPPPTIPPSSSSSSSVIQPPPPTVPAPRSLNRTNQPPPPPTIPPTSSSSIIQPPPPTVPALRLLNRTNQPPRVATKANPSNPNNHELSGCSEEKDNKLKRKKNNQPVKNVKKNKYNLLNIKFDNPKFKTETKLVDMNLIKKKLKEYEKSFSKDKAKVMLYLNAETGETVKLNVKENLKEKLNKRLLPLLKKEGVKIKHIYSNYYEYYKKLEDVYNKYLSRTINGILMKDNMKHEKLFLSLMNSPNEETRKFIQNLPKNFNFLFQTLKCSAPRIICNGNFNWAFLVVPTLYRYRYNSGNKWIIDMIADNNMFKDRPVFDLSIYQPVPLYSTAVMRCDNGDLLVKNTKLYLYFRIIKSLVFSKQLDENGKMIKYDFNKNNLDADFNSFIKKIQDLASKQLDRRHIVPDWIMTYLFFRGLDIRYYIQTGDFSVQSIKRIFLSQFFNDLSQNFSKVFKYYCGQPVESSYFSFKLQHGFQVTDIPVFIKGIYSHSIRVYWVKIFLIWSKGLKNLKEMHLADFFINYDTKNNFQDFLFDEYLYNYLFDESILLNYYTKYGTEFKNLFFNNLQNNLYFNELTDLSFAF
ncbi:hypothetical protein ABK040_004476 [Willaertia magna]